MTEIIHFIDHRVLGSPACIRGYSNKSFGMSYDGFPELGRAAQERLRNHRNVGPDCRQLRQMVEQMTMPCRAAGEYIPAVRNR
jgi:hypothetical protein